MLGGMTPPPPPPGPGAKSEPAPKIFACAETMVRPAGQEASCVAVDAAGSVVAAFDVVGLVIDPPAVGDSPPPQAARAAAPKTVAMRVIFITRPLLRDRDFATRAGAFSNENGSYASRAHVTSVSQGRSSPEREYEATGHGFPGRYPIEYSTTSVSEPHSGAPSLLNRGKGSYGNS
jgi:hypothetical protein